MNNNEILNEYFIWEEKNLIEHQKNSENKNVSETNDTMTNTKTDSTQIDWRNITDPKLRRQMRQRDHYKVNKDKKKLYYEINKDKRKSQMKAYREANKERLYKQTLEWKMKNKNNIQYKLSCRLRQRLRDALNVKHKVGSSVRDLGCTVTEFKSYLESKFQTGMTWDNYGLYGWHIDHIKPLASFDLTDRKQMLEACHYTNLQPLWAKDNLSKNDRLI